MPNRDSFTHPAWTLEKLEEELQHFSLGVIPKKEMITKLAQHLIDYIRHNENK